MTNQPAAPISAMTAADIVSELRRCDHVLTSRIVTLLDSLAEITPSLESAASMLERVYTGPDVAGMARSVREMAGVTEPDPRDALLTRARSVMQTAADTIDALEDAAGYDRRRSAEVREVVAAIDGARGGAE